MEHDLPHNFEFRFEEIIPDLGVDFRYGRSSPAADEATTGLNPGTSTSPGPTTPPVDHDADSELSPPPLEDFYVELQPPAALPASTIHAGSRGTATPRKKRRAERVVFDHERWELPRGVLERWLGTTDNKALYEDIKLTCANLRFRPKRGCPFPGCDRILPEKTRNGEDMVGHLLTEHARFYPYSCERCETHFAVEKRLTRHVREQHDHAKGVGTKRGPKKE